MVPNQESRIHAHEPKERRKKGEKGEDEPNQKGQPHKHIMSTKLNSTPFQIHEELTYTKNYKFKCSS